jgi:hypothetical protein
VLNYNLEPKTDTLDISIGFVEGELKQSVFGVSGLNVGRAIMLASTTRRLTNHV